ncbi:carboxypeptidase-like regulatory domain-containing protein [Algibacter agarivorans]|uniref:Carboxypeptidase-like regulatory domain-containing protein n=1 Tax=Algibacter agarivorans TaxID=1109741 RepID=A0ABP9GTC8_9FLAO
MNKLIFVIVFLSLSLNAQVQQKKVPFVEVLEYLESKHPYQFNYLFQTIDEVLVFYPPEKSSFEDAIAFLEKHTELNFSILNDFVSITNTDTFFLCGYLKDIETKSPIAFATIQSKNASASSDKNGYFKLEIKKKKETIIIRHLGYKRLKRAFRFFNTETCGTIYLVPEVVKLQQVVLSNYLAEGINKLYNSSFQINFSEFGILPGLIETDILQTVRALPGIHSVDETVSNINIRGGSNDENLLLWDGIKMYQSGHFFGLISIFNPKMTDKAILTKNGTSVHHSDGVSGTIEMHSSEDINDDFKGSIGVNFLNLDVFADIPISTNSSLQISARKGLSDFFKTPTYNSYFDRIQQDSELEMNTEDVNNSNIEFDFYDTGLRWLYQIDEKNQFRLNLLTVSNELIFDENATLNGIDESRRSSLVQNSFGAGLFYKRIWTTKFETALQIYETDYKLKAINANIILNQRALQENKVSETGVKLNTTYKVNEQFSLLNGYQFIETQVTNFDDVDNPVFSLYVVEVLRTHGLYSQIKFLSEHKKSSITAGIRANYIPKLNKYIFEPRLSFNQKINPYFNLEILGEFKHQITSQIINFQNDFFGIEKHRWQLSNNTNIPVIQSKQVSLGLQYNRNGWLINGEGYFKKVAGITTQSQGFQNQYVLARTDGDYKAFGFDFLARKQFDSFNIWLSYTYMDNYYNFEMLQNNNFHTNFDFTNALTLGTTYSLNDFKISTGLNWHSGKPTTRPISGNEISGGTINYESANSSRLKDYTRIDISSTYQFDVSKNTKANIGASIWNLLNQKNNLNTYYRIDNNDGLEQVSQASLGITPNVSFRISF